MRSLASCGHGVDAWQQGERSGTVELLRTALRVNRQAQCSVVAAVSWSHWPGLPLLVPRTAQREKTAAVELAWKRAGLP